VNLDISLPQAIQASAHNFPFKIQELTNPVEKSLERSLPEGATFRIEATFEDYV
jgi:hypothetical protein